MRTTVTIDDALLERAKQRATRRGITLGRYVDEALQRHLTGPDRAAEPVDLPVFVGGSGLRPGIDPSSNEDLWNALDEDEAG